MIEVALAIVFARHLGSNDVFFAQFRTCRNVLLSGVEDLVVPTMTKIPRRLQIEPTQKTQDALSRVQWDASNMAPFEHFCWDNIKNLSKDAYVACNSAISLNIMVGSILDTTQVGSGIGMKLIWSGHTGRYKALRLVVGILQGRINISTTFDENIVAPDARRKMLGQFESTIYQIIGAGSEQRVGNILLENACENIEDALVLDENST